MSCSNRCLIETKLYAHNSILTCLCRTHKLYSVVRHGTLDSLMKSLSCLTLSNVIQCTCVKSRGAEPNTALLRWVKCVKESVNRRGCFREGTCSRRHLSGAGHLSGWRLSGHHPRQHSSNSCVSSCEPMYMYCRFCVS